MAKLKPIETEKDIARAMKALLAADPRLVPVAEIAGPLPLRRRAGGFEGLANHRHLAADFRHGGGVDLGAASRQRSIRSRPSSFF